jgi:hypothetical protein
MANRFPDKEEICIVVRRIVATKEQKFHQKILIEKY